MSKHIILSSSKHKHLWANWTLGTDHSSTNDLQTHKLVPKYNKQKYKPIGLHCGKRVKNAYTMEKKFYGSQNNHSILQQYIYASAKTSPKIAKGILPSHHNNIDGKLLTIVQYNLHMGNFAKYRIVVQTCTQQVVGG